MNDEVKDAYRMIKRSAELLYDELTVDFDKLRKD